MEVPVAEALPTERSLADVRSLLSQLSADLAGLSVSECGESDLAALLGDVRGAQRRLDGLVMRIGVRSNELAADGAAASAEEVLRGAGDVGSRQARRESARAQVAEQIDGLGDAASNGRTTGEHIDSIARHTAKLSDEQRALLDFDDLVDRATRMLPESFDRYLKRQVDAAKADHGLGDTIAKQAASEFRPLVRSGHRHGPVLGIPRPGALRATDRSDRPEDGIGRRRVRR